jgi:hypothetical protein
VPQADDPCEGEPCEAVDGVVDDFLDGALPEVFVVELELALLFGGFLAAAVDDDDAAARTGENATNPTKPVAHNTAN